MQQHVATKKRVLTAVAASAAVVVLPVLGAAPAVADPGGTPPEQANESARGAEARQGGGGSGAAAEDGAPTAADADGDRPTNDPKTDDNEMSETPDNGYPNGANAGDGAGDDNPYASTETNGEREGGNAPVNGSVGNADDKFPAGQAPDGPKDANQGYECDGNSGVGDDGGNPAHTGCETPTTSTPPGRPNVPQSFPPPPTTTVVPPTVVPPVTTTTVTPSVLSSVLTRTTTPEAAAVLSVATPVSVAPATTAAAPSALPFTGDSTGLVALAAAGAVAAGTGLVVAGRRRA